MRGEIWVRYRIFLYLLLGLAAVDGLLRAVEERLAAYDPDDYLERLETCRGNQPDLVLVGGSAVTEGLDPASLTNLAWDGHALTRPFNLGMPGGTSTEVWHAVKHALAVPPRLLVYGITASDLNDGRQMPHGPWSLMDCRDLWHWLRSKPGSAEWVCRQFFSARCERLWKLYQHRNALRLAAADLTERLWPGSFTQVAREARKNRDYTQAMHRADGFAPQQDARDHRLDSYRAAGHVQPVYWALKDYHIDGGHLRDLHHMLDWAETHHVAVVLVDMPVSSDLEERLHPREFRLYRKVLAKLARDRRVPLLHASRPVLGLGDGDFSDEIHLNGAGCTKASGWLRTRLATLRSSVEAHASPKRR